MPGKKKKSKEQIEKEAEESGKRVSGEPDSNLAAVGAGLFASVDQACDGVVHVASRVKPDPASSALLQKNYAAFRRLYPALRSI